MTACKRHRDLRIDECAGCLIEKNNRLARRLKHPAENGDYWICKGCDPVEPCRLTATRGLVPQHCIRGYYKKCVWKLVEV